MSVKELLFIMILIAVSWEDYWTREIGSKILLISGCIGLFVSMLENVVWKEILCSCSIGIVLLGIGRATGGGIGEGDGWFFVVSGLYLNWRENMQLLISGLFLCFVWSLPLTIWSIVRNGKGRKRELPFLPFLLPAGIWLAVT